MYIKFNGKHPEAEKDKRHYSDNPRKNWNSYGASYSPVFFKLDIDDFKKSGEIEEPIHGKPRSDALVAILDFLKIRYNGIKTEHGKQLYFRVPDWMEQRNKINWYCPLGVKCEWKFPSRDDHIPLKINGVEREFFKGSITNEDFLYPLQGYKNKPFMLDFPEGGRTQKLGAYIFYLVKKGYPDFSKDFDGIERRVVIFEFKHIFKKGDPQFNPVILESLTSDECISTLLNRAISGYKSLIDNKGFITTKESEQALADFVSDNDSVVKWLHEADIDEDYLLREPIKMGCKGLYREYQEFCFEAGEEAKAQKDFSRTICNMYGFKTRQKRLNGERPYMFERK